MDDDVLELPRYENVRKLDPWPYVLDYLNVNDLKRFALVSRELRGRVQGHLWREPRKYWPSEEADAFSAFKHFLDTLETVTGNDNPGVYTQVLDISRLDQHHFNVGVHKDWLSRALTKLPNIVALNVSGITFFDHDSILAGGIQRQAHLRSLIIRDCTNVTTKAFTAFLFKTPQLHYLDLSFTKIDNKKDLGTTISSRSLLPRLQVLKLRQIGLNDEDLLWLCGGVKGGQRRMPGLGLRVWSLDVRDNFLTDASGGILGQYSSALPGLPSYADLPPPPYASSQTFEHPSPFIVPGTDWTRFFESRFAVRREGDALAAKDDERDVIEELQKSSRPNNNLTLQSGNERGITHLYISGNKLTYKGVALLFSLTTLQALDCGTVSAASLRTESNQGCDGDALAAALHLVALSRTSPLQYLRINHRIVTGFSAYVDQLSWGNASDGEDARGLALNAISQAQKLLDATIPHMANGSHWLNSKDRTIRGRQWLPDEPPPYTEDSTAHQLTVDFRFDPALLGIRKLVLTDVPAHSPRGELADCLRKFLQACGDMQRISAEYAWRQRNPDSDLPDLLPRSRLPLVLEELRLEIAESQSPTSSSEESSAFAVSSKDDFSFFPEEKAIISSVSAESGTISPIESATHQDYDVVKALARFRQEQRERRQQSLGSGRTGLASFWDGKLQVLR
ncbi:MAG: hypothetical protein M1822_009352 [Bathelium mastoideum]|nr:MAG: hypothetical protein M1822_009352 [Bathelium mastoideum]